MSVKRDDSGRRYVEAEIEVPGTPEEVWRAIATGPGISAWFVPTEVDGRVGGESKSNFGPGMESVAKITGWNPPHKGTFESQDLGPEAPTVGTEWIVEARGGGKCVVRVVHSLFADTDDWDKELEAWEGGWPDFFRILLLYLKHFPGQPSALLQLSAMTSAPPSEAWAKLCGALGVQGIGAGDSFRTEAGPPVVAAEVEHVGQGHAPHAGELLLRTSEPLPGLAHWFALGMGEQTVISLRFYLYGASAQSVVDRDEPAWSAWMSTQFPSQAT